jgi:hypothetical protein
VDQVSDGAASPEGVGDTQRVGEVPVDQSLDQGQRA